MGSGAAGTRNDAHMGSKHAQSKDLGTESLRWVSFQVLSEIMAFIKF